MINKSPVEKLVEDNYNLVYYHLRKFKLLGNHDAESDAQFALLSAALNYEPNKNIKFGTYASVCIMNALRGRLRKIKSSTVCLSFDYIYDSGEDKDVQLFDLIGTVALEELLEEKERLAFVEACISDVIDSLTEKQAVIVNKWKESDYLCTSTQIGLDLSVSQSYVSYTLKIFKNNLKKKLEEY